MEVELPVFCTETVASAFEDDLVGTNEVPGPVSSDGVGSWSGLMRASVAYQWSVFRSKA